METVIFRRENRNRIDEDRANKIERAKVLSRSGYSVSEISEALGIQNDSNVRSLLNS